MSTPRHTTNTPVGQSEASLGLDHRFFSPSPLSVSSVPMRSPTLSSDDFFQGTALSAEGIGGTTSKKFSNDVLDILETLNGSLNPEHILIVEDILENVARSQWESNFRNRLRMNNGTAKALFLFLKEC